MKKIQKSILFLVLSFIILFIITLKINTGYALQEVIDDYENEDNVQAKNNIVRDAPTNSMILSYSMGDDIYTWIDHTEDNIELDSMNDITVIANRTTATTMTRYAHAYNYVPFEFTLPIDFNVTIWNSLGSTDLYHTWGHFALTNSTVEMQNRNSTTDLFIGGVRNVADNYFKLLLYGVTSDSFIHDIGYGTYYLKVRVRKYWCSVEVHHPEGVILDTLNVSMTGYMNYHYVGTIGTHWVGSGQNRPVSPQTREITYNQTVSGYKQTGYFYTTELLNTVNGSTVVLLTNSTLEGGSINVGFSSDNITFVDHNGIVGSDSLIEGNESIDLRDLGYTDLHVRYEYSRGGLESTPRLYQMIVITSGEGVGNGNGVTEVIATPLIVFGLIIGLILGFGLMKSN